MWQAYLVRTNKNIIDIYGVLFKMRKMNTKAAFILLSCALSPLMISTAHADAKSDEKANLKACEVKICGLVVNKKAEGENVSCDLTKTWGNDELAKGMGDTMKWSWGDAQCSVNFNLPAQPMIDALGADKKELNTKPADVTCNIGSGDKKDALTFKMAPALVFEKGVVTSAKLGISDVKGPFMQRMTIKAAALVEKTSLFKGAAVKEVNKFLSKCPKKVAAK